MKNSAIVPEVADPYATLEKILKIVGRSWLSEEWRLEDIRLLAQEAIATRTGTSDAERVKGAIQSLQPRIRMMAGPEAQVAAQQREGLPS